jgi:hypothetical protein
MPETKFDSGTSCCRYGTNCGTTKGVTATAGELLGAFGEAREEIERWRNDYNSARRIGASDNRRPKGSRGHSKTTRLCLEKWHNFGIPVSPYKVRKLFFRASRVGKVFITYRKRRILTSVIRRIV